MSSGSFFGQLDNEPIANTDLRLGQQLAVSYDKVRDHRASNDHSPNALLPAVSILSLPSTTSSRYPGT